MIIALTTQGPTLEAAMDPRFGRTRYLLICDDTGDSVEAVDNADAAAGAHGAGPRAVRALVDRRVDVLVTGNGPGGNAATALRAAGIAVHVGASEMSARQALAAYGAGELASFAL